MQSWICLGFALDLSDIHLLDIDLSDADLDLLDTDIDSFTVNIFLSPRRLEDILQACLKKVLKTSSV